MSSEQLPDGYTPLEPGRIAAVVTYLEMKAPPEVDDRPLPPGAEIRRFGKPDLGRYRQLFRDVGEHWLWLSRLAMSDAELAAILSDPNVEVYVLEVEGIECGLLELDFRDRSGVELVFLGLTPDMTGKGLGGHLMEAAIRRAWRDMPPRFWLHTCTFDHPAAVGFYIRYGFKPYMRAIEVSGDPRQSGLLPRSAAPQIPLIEG